MTEPVDWAHRESLRQWRILAARGHEEAMAVISHQGLTPLSYPGLPPLSAPHLLPASVSAAVPRAPRPVAAPTPTIASAGLQRRLDKLTRLVSPPTPPKDLF
jgi:hypothetical protein